MKKIKNIIFIVCILVIGFFVYKKLNVKTVEQFYDSTKADNSVGTISLGIYTDTIKDKTDNKEYATGVLFEDKILNIYQNENCYDVLVRLMKEKKILIDATYNETFESAYVKGINGLYEFDYGDLSGWVFFVNGEMPDRGCSQIILKDGDVVNWHYTLNLGMDIEE